MTDLFDILEATWPAASERMAGGWRVREGQGGGKRVSSATLATDEAVRGIDQAEAAHSALGQPPLFCLRPDQADADAALAERGYHVIDPVILYSAPTAQIGAEAPARLTSFPIWPPLAIMKDIWADGHIGPERLAVMERVAVTKTAILGRQGDRPAGAVFVAVQGDTAMIHALHVDPGQRRQGLARNLMRAAARWAEAQGATSLALAVTEGNLAANALYQALGMQPAGRYHYRAK